MAFGFQFSQISTISDYDHSDGNLVTDLCLHDF